MVRSRSKRAWFVLLFVALLSPAARAEEQGDDRDELTRRHFNGQASVVSTDWPAVEQLAISLFGRPLEAPDFIKLAGAFDGSEVVVSAATYNEQSVLDNPHLALRVEHAYVDQRRGTGMVIRYGAGAFGEGPRTQYVDRVFLNESLAPPGLGTRIAAHLISSGQEFAYTWSFLHGIGAPNGEFNGYYTWARLGYNTNLRAGERRSTGLADLNDVMRHPEGPRWWRRNGGERWMRFALDPSSRQSQMHRAYLETKGVRIRRTAVPQPAGRSR